MYYDPARFNWNFNMQSFLKHTLSLALAFLDDSVVAIWASFQFLCFLWSFITGKRTFGLSRIAGLALPEGKRTKRQFRLWPSRDGKKLPFGRHIETTYPHETKQKKHSYQEAGSPEECHWFELWILVPLLFMGDFIGAQFSSEQGSRTYLHMRLQRSEFRMWFLLLGGRSIGQSICNNAKKRKNIAHKTTLHNSLSHMPFLNFI